MKKEQGEAGKGPGGLAIAQGLLAQYQETVSACRRQEARRAQLRERIMGLLERGAPVEPGPLDAAIEVSEQVHFSKAKLTALFGAAWVETARRQIGPTPVHRLVVEGREPGAARKRRKARRARPGDYPPDDFV